MKVFLYQNGGLVLDGANASIIVIKTDEHSFHLEVDGDGALVMRADNPLQDVTAQPTIMGPGDDMIGLKLRTE